jgi:hypothetical protein
MMQLANYRTETLMGSLLELFIFCAPMWFVFRAVSRRLHDANLSEFWLLVPVLGWLARPCPLYGCTARAS